MTSPAERRTTVYDTAALEKVLDDLAAGLAHRLHSAGPITLVGVLRRGAPLADLLLPRVQALLPGVEIDRLDLRIKRYADDLTLLHPETKLTETGEHDTIDLTGRAVAIIDDVLYLGHSLNRALQFLLGKGATTIVSVVLVDRCCVQLPLHADVAGIKLQVAPDQIVECQVPPYEPVFQIVLVH